jgi:hypothetical protein
MHNYNYSVGIINIRHIFLRFIIPILLISESYCAQPQGIYTRVPSEVAGNEGLVVRINTPVTSRYGNDGAPVVVYGAGGFQSDGVGQRETGLTEYGFIEVRFNFQGGGSGNYQSGGVYDNRGPQSLIAFRDIIQFINGSLTDINGKLFSDIVDPIVPLITNIGLIGWSNGGNTDICVAGVHGHEIDNLAWIINWESPVGDGMPQAEAGAKSEGKLRPLNAEVNPAYDPATGDWDLSRLSYDDAIQIPTLENTNIKVTGGLFFDFNNNNIVDPGLDFIPYPLVFNTKDGYKAYYSERLREKAEDENLFPSLPPSHVPTFEETKTFWYWRNGEYWIDTVITKFPKLLFMIVANDTDHVQRSPDHPHVLIQYNRFVRAGTMLVRLNPDRVYIEDILGYHYPEAVDNNAFMVLNYTNIQNAVEPGNAQKLFGKVTIATAGACELADRVKTDNLELQLHEILTDVKMHPILSKDFILFQNYPNPFNDNTSIKFSICHSRWIVLNVYDICGKEITTLVNERFQAGQYNVIWDAKNMASGIYFYKIYIDKFVSVKKMVLVR